MQGTFPELTAQQQEALLQAAGERLGLSPETLREKLGGSPEALAASLPPAQAAQLAALLREPQKLQQLLAAPQSAMLLQMLLRRR